MRRKKKGFTLIELMVVIVILGVLAAVVVPKVMNRPEEAKRVMAKSQMRIFETALDLYKADNGKYPTTDQGLLALVEKTDIPPEPKNWKGPYIKSDIVPLDPWNNEYIYISPGIHNRDYDIESYGSDGEEGGENENEDIRNYTKKNEQ